MGFGIFICLDGFNLQESHYIFKIVFLLVTLDFSSSIEAYYTKSHYSEAVSSNTIHFIFIPHELILSVHEQRTVTCAVELNGTTILEEVTLHFDYSKTDIIQYISDILVYLNDSDQSLTIPIFAEHIGHTVIHASAMPVNMTDTKNGYVLINVHYSDSLDSLSEIVGWTYFVSWSVSFYPQIVLNWKRKSVLGLHFDFLALNTFGFLVYNIFNVGLYWIPSMREEYSKRHPYGINPIRLNDVIFSSHALFACFIQLVQCLLYERGDQRISKMGRSILGGLSIFSLITLILGSTTVITWLDFLYILSYIKLFITLIKYIPQITVEVMAARKRTHITLKQKNAQAYFNYLRKSTSGWSIGNIILDFTGGSFSISQMFILAYNYDDWSSIFGDPTKFGLGLFSILFDIFFMFQHYTYNRWEAYRSLSEMPAVGTISQHDSSGSSHIMNYGSIIVNDIT